MSGTERLSVALADRYTIERQLGQGGMATVYLAQDRKHERKVALKVLKPELAAVLGAERFVAEIKTTAALQHPHILPLFDSGSADGFLYYVMPYVEGETLRSKLDRETQLGVEEAVRITTEVADALDYAHRHGVIHRDIKPENILLHDGRPVVADFGIALAVSAAAGGRMTETGLSLGTPHYMSPEQATADKEITARSDIYSLGSVLYEMLAGAPPHLGSSAQQIIMKIIAEPAAPLTSLRKSVPPNVAAAVAQALEKVPADRFESAKAFAHALNDRHFTTATMPAGVAPTAAGRHTWRSWLADPRSWAALGIAVLTAATAMFARPARAPDASATRALRFTVLLPPDSSLFGLATQGPIGLYRPVVSPDGRHLAFRVLKTTGSFVYLRSFDAFDVTEVAGDAALFSPDGRRVALLRESDVWFMNIGDKVPTRIGVIPETDWDLYGADWHADGRLLFAASRGLWALPSNGGDASLLIAADTAAGEDIRVVQALPDGRLLLGVRGRDGLRMEIAAANGGDRRRIMPGAESGYLAGDVLVFQQSGQLRATRVDPRTLQPVGEAITLQENSAMRPGRSIAWPDEQAAMLLRPAWVTQAGVVSEISITPGAYRWPRVSPRDGRIAIGVLLRTGHQRPRVYSSGGVQVARLDGYSEPVWSRDARFIYTSRGNRPFGGLVVQVADGSRPPDTLLVTKGDSWPTDVSPDGRWLVYYGVDGEIAAGADIGDLRFMDLTTRQTRTLRLPLFQRGARFSPDGRWVAYQSTETGQEEVYVRPWPELDASYQISSGGGTEPIWSADGRTLYYRRHADVLAADLTVRDGGVAAAAGRVLFSGVFAHDFAGDQSWDLAPDGRFLMLRPMPGAQLSVQVVLNWIDEVRERLNRAQ